MKLLRCTLVRFPRQYAHALLGTPQYTMVILQVKRRSKQNAMKCNRYGFSLTQTDDT